MKHTVAGIVHTRIEAEDLLTSLQAAGHTSADFSALFPDKEGFKDFAHKNSTKAPEGAVTGASTVGTIGGIVGLMAGIGALAIPGVGPLIAAGPIMATLSGAAVGAAVGGVSGGLIGMGIPEYEAKLYEGKIRDGNMLIAVHCANGDQAKAAKEMFKQYNASDIHEIGEASVGKR